MFLDTIELRTGNKNLSLGKTVLIMWSLIGGKIAQFVHNIIYIYISVYIYIFFFSFFVRFYVVSFFSSSFFFELIFQSYFIDQLSHFSTNLRPHLQNSFFKTEFFVSMLSSRMSRNMHKLRPKLRNAKIYPHKVQTKNLVCNFRLSKTYSPSVFFIDGLRLYFLKA